MNKNMWELFTRLHTALAWQSGPFTIEQVGARAGLTLAETLLRASVIGRCMKRLGWVRSAEEKRRYYKHARDIRRRDRTRTDVAIAVDYVRAHQGMRQRERPSYILPGALQVALERGLVIKENGRLYVR